MEFISAFGTSSLYALMGGVLITAALTVAVRNMFHAAIFLAFTLLGVAIIYFFLHAEFIAAIQILIYVGAIMTLVIFAIMLTARIQDPSVPQSNRQIIPALVLIAACAYLVVRAIVNTPWKFAAQLQETNAVELGRALMGRFVLPFELVSLVLLVALIGAIAVARSDE